MARFALVVALLASSVPCLAVDLRGTRWYGDGQMAVSLGGQTETQLYSTMLSFTGNTPRNGRADLSDIACRWSSSIASNTFTLVPLGSEAEELAQAIRDEIPDAKVKVKGIPTRGIVSPPGTISYGLRFAITIKQGRTRTSGYVTLTQYGHEIGTAAAPAALEALCPAVERALATLRRR